MEKEKIENVTDLYPPKNGLKCIQAMPWLHYLEHKEPVSRVLDSVSKITFSKLSEVDKELMTIDDEYLC